MEFTGQEVIDFLKKNKIKVPSGKVKYFQCPFCSKENSGIFLPIQNNYNCLSCKTKVSFFDFVRKFKGISDSDEAIIRLVNKTIGKIPEVAPNSSFCFVHYSSCEFKLIPLSPQNKRPMWTDWTNRGVSDKNEWESWVGKYNFGLILGEETNTIAIDFDRGEVPLFFLNCGTLSQKTTRGYHFVFKYNPKYKNTKINTDKYAIDILGNGKQIVVPPSVAEGVPREWDDFVEPIVMPKEVEDFLDSLLQKETFVSQEEESGEDVAVKVNEGDGRNNMLIHLGGILKKTLSLNQCVETLRLINQKFFNPPLPNKEINALLNSLDKYISYDEKDIAFKIFEYLKMAEFANSRDILSLETFDPHKKVDIEKALSFLVREGYAYKKGRNYYPVVRTTWEEDLTDSDVDLKFNVPFFSKYANFVNGDLILLGATTGSGKTHLSMNFVKQFRAQGIVPYYYSNEVGSRFKRTAIKLGLVSGDLKYSPFCNPRTIELEKNVVTIVDWILPDNYAETDKLMGELGAKVNKAGGLLIVFMQLKDDKTWYSKAMSQFFPAFTARYLYEDETGANTYFQIDKVREPKIPIKNFKIPCKYNFSTKMVEIIND